MPVRCGWSKSPALLANVIFHGVLTEFLLNLAAAEAFSVSFIMVKVFAILKLKESAADACPRCNFVDSIAIRRQGNTHQDCTASAQVFVHQTFNKCAMLMADQNSAAAVNCSSPRFSRNSLAIERSSTVLQRRDSGWQLRSSNLNVMPAPYLTDCRCPTPRGLSYRR